MDTSLERIRAKIADLEAKITDLRIAERELQSLERPPARKPKTAAKAKPAPRQKLKGKPKADDQPETQPTMGSVIAEVLGQQGALSATEIADHIKATGREVNNRAVSFSLQSLKKRGLAKRADGKWALSKAGARQPRS